jgi:preprotein translocase subunit SecA
LRGYGQKDPRVEYEKEAYEIFEDLKSNIADEAVKAIFLVRIEIEQPAPPEPQPVAVGANGATAFEPLPTGELVPQAASRLDPVAAERLLGPAPRVAAEHVHTNREDARPKSGAPEKVGRNDLCPCGSGKKFKRCHGAAA